MAELLEIRINLEHIYSLYNIYNFNNLMYNFIKIFNFLFSLEYLN